VTGHPPDPPEPTTWGGPDAVELEWQRRFGRWDPLRPIEVAELLRGYRGEWWVVGGHAIDAWTGRKRVHEDVDVAVWARDLAHLRRHLDERLDLWLPGPGWLRALTPEFYPCDAGLDDLPSECEQVWLRRSAAEPWLADLLLCRDVDGGWQNKRDLHDVRPLDEVTWVGPDGVRYARPEIVLFYKAKAARPKDDLDLARTIETLEPTALGWLAEALGRVYPGHRWLEVVAAGSGRTSRS